MTARQPAPTSPRWPLVALLVVGLGLAAAPLAFQMFDRAPRGRTMIDSFEPYMTEQRIASFQADLRTIDAAVEESRGPLRTALAEQGAAASDVATAHPLLTGFEDDWPAIDQDMSEMLATMDADRVNYDAVAALPPFDLFPWFFVVPGLILAAAAGVALVARRRGRSTRPWLIVAVVVGAGLVVAPGVFQMFERAPRGGRMVDDFRPLMTEAEVRRVQGYFVVIGGGEGTLRTEVLPDLKAAGSDPDLPAIDRFIEQWPRTSNEMAPMIGAMSDNLTNYQAVAALPPFPLFPWFFVVPGVAVVALAGLAARARPAEPREPTDPTHPPGGTP